MTIAVLSLRSPLHWGVGVCATPTALTGGPGWPGGPGCPGIPGSPRSPAEPRSPFSPCREAGGRGQAQDGDNGPQNWGNLWPPHPAAGQYSPLQRGQQVPAAPGYRVGPGGQRKRGVSWGALWVMTPLPVLQGCPAMGIVLLYQLTMSPGGPCRPWGPMGPGSPWERQHDEGGRVGLTRLRAPAPTQPLAHLRSRPARDPWGAGFATVTLEGGRDMVGSAVHAVPGPGPRSLGMSPHKCPPVPPSLTFGPGRPGCPVFPLKPWGEKRAGWGSQSLPAD